ncbi:MAG: Gfo/Idh/MocA family protein [Thermomicrobiales bacterium]
MSYSPVRWGIIGAGDIAERVMAPAMRAAPHNTLVAVSRRDRAAAAAFAERHGAQRAYDSVEALLRDPEVDAVYIATPVARHCPDALAAAAHGKHILCEKPLALTIAEGEQMRAACAAAGVQFMTCFYQRFNARHRQIRELLAAGAIGQVTAARWTFSGRSADRPGAWRQDPAQAGGGCYMDNASHCVDLLRFLLGEIIVVSAFVDTLAARYAVEDTATSILRLASGAHAVITSYWSTGDPDDERNSRLEIFGTEGAIISTPLHDKFSRGRLTVATRAGEQEYTYETSTHVALLEEFAAALAEGRPPAITVDDGLAALRTVQAVYESARTGATVRVG